MEIPYTVTARPDTGLWNAKIGIWLFLASEVMLFGGLFSSYIFLRIGADYYWPIHELNVKMGCFNTAVLIASSVTIVMAWAGVKMRKFNMYRLNLIATILCAFLFLFVKFFEYKAKIEHYGVVLKDGTIMLGHLPEEGYKIKFNVESLTLNTKDDTSDPAYFMRYAVAATSEHGGAHDEHEAAVPATLNIADVKFKTDDGKEVSLAQWPELQKAAREHKNEKGELKPIDTIKFTAVKPFALHADPKKLLNYTPEALSFIDSTSVTGKLVDDSMELHCDVVDTRGTPDADKSVAWTLFKDPEWKKAFDEQRHEGIEKFEAGPRKGQDPMKNAVFLREHMRMEVHGETAAAHEAKHKAHTEGGMTEGFFDDMPWATHHYPHVTIPANQIERWSNFLPSWNTYYAIYFCITGLHGLHVLGGALVMSYFLFFNSHWFKKDPEHLANRVETGGLFWHFVDLVWIFLFPLLYLL